MIKDKLLITQENFRSVLKILNFEDSGDVYTKHFLNTESILKVNFKKHELIYPEDKGFVINERQTCNFSSNENFVVLYEIINNDNKIG